MSVSPISVRELFQLTKLGIPQDSINFKSVTLQSDKYITVNQGSSLSVVDVATKNVLPLPVSVDSAIMNPSSKIIAVRSKPANQQATQLKIYNLDTKTNLKSSSINDTVVYWKWINDKAIALVTSKSVFH